MPKRMVVRGDAAAASGLATRYVLALGLPMGDVYSIETIAEAEDVLRVKVTMIVDVDRAQRR